MFGTLGGPELFLIFVVALIVFGPRKLPDIGKSLGKMMAEFRRASNEFKSTIESEVEAEKIRDSMRIETPAAAPAYPLEATGATATSSPTTTETPGTDTETPAADAGAPTAPTESTEATESTETVTAPAPDAPPETVPETVSRQPDPTPIEPK
jgi:Tat protein translocase TatB subunit